MKPITRKEYYLAKAAGTYTGPTPPPVLREDYYLATLAGDYSGNCPAPVTRIEKYMSAAAGLTTYVPQPVTRVEKFWYAIAKGTGYVPEPVTREEKFLYAILKNPPKPEYLDKTAEGSTILLTDSAQAPLTALTVYGHSTQDGTPSPENPVPIVSAGDDGEINVTVQGGNLVDLNVSASMHGNSTYSYDGYTATLTTILTEEDLTDLAPAKNRIYRSAYIQLGDDFAGKTVTISYDSAEIMFDMEQIIGLVYTDDSGTIIYNHLASNIESKSLTIAIPDTATNIRFRIMLIEANSLIENLTPGTYTAKINGIMLALGTSKLPWMPYKLPQTLTLQTPNGLPGIPVDSGGNYTDENGQQWVCDEIDMARGKYVQRVAIKQKNGNFQMAESADEPGRYYQYGVLGIIFKNGYYESFCNIASWALWGIDDTHTSTNWLFALNSNGFYISPPSESGIESAEELSNLLNSLEFPVVFVGQLETPIETDLTAEEIAAYKALHTYSPATTVSNDAAAWMEVGYKATP